MVDSDHSPLRKLFVVTEFGRKLVIARARTFLVSFHIVDKGMPLLCAYLAANGLTL